MDTIVAAAHTSSGSFAAFTLGGIAVIGITVVAVRRFGLRPPRWLARATFVVGLILAVAWALEPPKSAAFAVVSAALGGAILVVAARYSR